MDKALQDILGDYEAFLNSIFTSLNVLGVDVSPFFMDHICYRVSTAQEYSVKKDELSKIATLILENKIDGRLISKFKLFVPLIYKEREVFIIELPSPKEGSPYKDGLEHVEFVINTSLNDFILQYPDINFDKDGLAKSSNADVFVKLEKYVAKFHEKSLEEIINIEMNNLEH